MLKSMTGFGKSTTILTGKSLTFEIRSLNSKQLDLNLRFPSLLRDLEPEIRKMVTRVAERGKIELTASIDFIGSDLPASINKPLAMAYYRELQSLAEELNAPAQDLLSLVMKMPEITKNTREEFSEEEKTSILTAVEQALELYDEFRKHEGQLLENDFVDRIHSILKYLEQIEPFEKQRGLNMREKLRNGFAAFSEDNTFDSNRFEQEIIYYLEKLDINEEKVRLKKHCDYFLEALKEPVANGRKLSFVSQEIGREINTIGSKANDASIQKIVVGMKDELEKIKEQLANIL